MAERIWFWILASDMGKFLLVAMVSPAGLVAVEFGNGLEIGEGLSRSAKRAGDKFKKRSESLVKSLPRFFGLLFVNENCKFANALFTKFCSPFPCNGVSWHLRHEVIRKFIFANIKFAGNHLKNMASNPSLWRRKPLRQFLKITTKLLKFSTHALFPFMPTFRANFCRCWNDCKARLATSHW